MKEIEIEMGEGATFCFSDVLTGNDFEYCSICDTRISDEYVSIIENLKKALLLDENYEKLCCFCYNIIYRIKYLKIQAVFKENPLDVRYYVDDGCYNNMYKLRILLVLEDGGSKTATRIMEAFDSVLKTTRYVKVVKNVREYYKNH